MFNLKKERRYTFAELRKFTGDFMVGASLCPPPYYLISRPWGAIIFVSFQQNTFNLDNFTNFKALFPVVFDKFSLTYPRQKLKKVVERSIGNPGLANCGKNRSFVHKRLRYKQPVGLVKIMISDWPASFRMNPKRRQRILQVTYLISQTVKTLRLM